MKCTIAAFGSDNQVDTLQKSKTLSRKHVLG
jgi:hypothetical protein